MNDKQDNDPNQNTQVIFVCWKKGLIKKALIQYRQSGPFDNRELLDEALLGCSSQKAPCGRFSLE
jgi:hypothetical protein